MPLPLTTLCFALSASAEDFPVGGSLVSPPLGNFAEAVDLDGDGDRDVLAAVDQPRWRLVWFESAGGGNFERERAIAELDSPASSAVAVDLDGDGDLDVLAATEELGAPSRLAWFENLDGLGTFGGERLLDGAADDVASVVAADLDGDGDNDALVGARATDTVAWYANLDGAGTFGPRQVIGGGALGVEAVFASDLDGDADVDVLAASRLDDRVSWYENHGGGAFGAAQTITQLAGGAESVSAADLDGDGDQDALSASFHDDKIAWYANADGLGGFGVQSVLAQDMDQAVSVHAADLDADGDADVLGACVAEVSYLFYYAFLLSRVARYENLAPGSFGFGVDVTLDVPGATWVTTGDLDGNGQLDVLVGAVGGEDVGYGGLDIEAAVTWYANAGASPGPVPQQRVAPLVSDPLLAPGDLDGDGDEDLIVVGNGDGTIGWQENLDGAGSFGPRQVFGTQHGEGAPEAVDLDGDGDLDILVLEWDTATVVWYENQGGAGTFGPQMVALGPFVSDAIALDVDGDGLPDLVTASNADDDVAWHRNLGLGVFGPKQGIDSSVSTALSLEGADLDGDGDADLLAVIQTGVRQVVWYENTDGAGAFGAALPLASPTSFAFQARVADLDEDGELDVLWSEMVGFGSLYGIENLGAGTFGAEVGLLQAGTLNGFHPSDLDGDGDVDLATSSNPPDGLNWFENQGGWTFGRAQPIPAPELPATDLADLDGDGDDDLLVYGGSGLFDYAEWYENQACAASAVASEVVRVGSPPNPAVLLPGQTSPPIAGATWDPLVDHTSFVPRAALDFLGLSTAAVNVPTPFGTLLCAPGPAGLTFTAPPGQPFSLAIPDDCTLVGVALCAQAASLDSGPTITLTNALDLVVGSL
ncbi:MAG: VCBS repeat-containing protein [Planctomycetota bacterium]